MGRRDRWRMSGSVLRLSPFIFTSSNSCNIPSVSWIYFTWCNLHDWQTSSQNVVSSTLRVHSCLAKGIVWTGTLKFNFYIFDRPWPEASMLIHIITSLTKTILVPKRKHTKASEWLLLSATCNLWLYDDKNKNLTIWSDEMTFMSVGYKSYTLSWTFTVTSHCSKRFYLLDYAMDNLWVSTTEEDHGFDPRSSQTNWRLCNRYLLRLCYTHGWNYICYIVKQPFWLFVYVLDPFLFVCSLWPYIGCKLY